jgi:thioredoxin reductase
MYDLIIVGGGPAGITAAIYSIRKRLNVFLVSQDLGGKTNYRMKLPNMESHQVIRGVDVVEKFWRELDYLEFARHLEPVTSVTKDSAAIPGADTFTVTTAGGDEFQAKSIIFATGSRIRQLDVPGEREFIGRGLTYSAVSHAPMFIGLRAVVIGDGDLALRAVAELALVADTVHLITQVPGASRALMARGLVKSPKVVLWDGYSIKEIQGDGFAQRVLIEASGVIDEIETDGVFVELGLIPNTEPLQGLADLDDKGRIIIDKLNRTSCPGLFAAGDVTDAYAEQVLIAVGEGAKAALSAYDYLLPTL